MRHIVSIALLTLLLSSCASTPYHYQDETNPQKWEGKNISAVQKRWGSADDVYHTASGTSYYLYNTSSGRNLLDSTTTNFSLAESGADFPLRGQMGLACSAIFKTDKNGTIIATSHTGSSCGGEWAPGR